MSMRARDWVLRRSHIQNGTERTVLLSSTYPSQLCIVPFCTYIAQLYTVARTAEEQLLLAALHQLVGYAGPITVGRPRPLKLPSWSIQLNCLYAPESK